MNLDEIKKLLEGKDNLNIMHTIIKLDIENYYLVKKLEDKEKEIERLTLLMKE